MAGEKDPRQILKISGKTQFFEIMTNCLSLDKVYLNFEEYDDSKPAGQRKKYQVQIYLDCIEAYVISKDIFSGKFAMLGKKAKEPAVAGGYKYAREIYSSLGGISATKLAQKGKDRADGKSLSRCFKITPGVKSDWVLSAESGPGEESETGLIVPKYSKPEQIVRVALSNEQLKIFGGALELLVNSWMNEKLKQINNLSKN